MTRIDGPQKRDCFAATQFAHDQPVRPHTQRSAHKIVNCHACLTLIAGHSDQAKRIVAAQPDFRGVLNGNDPLMLRNFL